MIIKKIKYTFYNDNIKLTKINKLINDLFEIISPYFEEPRYINTLVFFLNETIDYNYIIFCKLLNRNLLEITLDKNEKIIDTKIDLEMRDNFLLNKILEKIKEYK
jgi:hypothetical protein